MTCRNAAKLAGLDVAKCEVPSVVHASTAACLSWRYAQLLAAMPQRETETESWQSCSVKLFEGVQGFHGAIADAFGNLLHLKGEGSAGSGAFADVVTRRMLPCG